MQFFLSPFWVQKLKWSGVTSRKASDRRSRLFPLLQFHTHAMNPPAPLRRFIQTFSCVKKTFAGADGLRSLVSFKNFDTKSHECSIYFLHQMFAIEPDSLLAIDNDPQRNKNIHFFESKTAHKYRRHPVARRIA